MPERLAKKYNAFPLNINGNSLLVGIENDNIYAIQDLKLATGMDIILKKEDKETIKENLKRIYNQSFKIDENYARNIFKSILEEAINLKVSDIHIEPSDNYLIIRMRVDGNLKEVSRFTIDVYPYLSSVIKLDMSMNITEKRLPQDGRSDFTIKNQLIDIRASSIPTVYGEKIVLRILNRDTFLKDKLELGFSNEAITKIKNILHKKSGILLVTGPTGSGKTTTVYSLLNDLKNISKNIMTIEDPVEYKMDGINQIQVNSKIGLTFDIGLRSILRQDPDIIMIGEIRDLETAKIAIRAATTGHLVISTMHTIDSISSISRLLDMNIEPYLINSSLIGVISQRLVRKLCNNCNDEKKNITCIKCNDNKYDGRTVIYEILEISEEIKECIQNKKSSMCIREVALKSNNIISFEDTIKNLIKDSITTLEECTVVNNI